MYFVKFVILVILAIFCHICYSIFSHSKKNSSYFCYFCDICYFFAIFLIAVFFKSFLLKLRKQFASKFLLTRSILDISGGGTLVTRALLRKVLTVEIYSEYTRKKTICLNRGREESVGNDDVSIICARKYTKWLGWRKDLKSQRDPLVSFCDIHSAVILRYSFVLRVIIVILWSSCFNSYGPKDTR